MLKKFLISLCVIFTASAGIHHISLKDAWARVGKTGKTSAIYFTIENNMHEDEELIGAHTSIAHMTEIHKTVTENGISQMVHIDRLVLPAEKTVVFKPKGLHIMLMGLKKDLTPGEEFELELEFKHSGKKTHKIKVKQQ
jgi:periplasmic copper chaperone A